VLCNASDETLRKQAVACNRELLRAERDLGMCVCQPPWQDARRLPKVAVAAGGYEVLKRRLAAARLGMDVIALKLYARRAASAVLAGE
jgi:hypothetical protein